MDSVENGFMAGAGNIGKESFEALNGETKQEGTKISVSSELPKSFDKDGFDDLEWVNIEDITEPMVLPVAYECVLCGYIMTGDVSDNPVIYLKCPKCGCEHKIETDSGEI